MVPLLLGVAPGDSVLDLCAAPGGKTLALARAAREGALVVAADRHLHRLGAMREHLRRTGMARVALVALDAALPLPWTHRFRRILVDAPCSGTGTLARNPEIRWRLKPTDLTNLQSRQVALLRNALDALDAGGRLIYSTCSLEPEENEQVVQQALAGRAEFRLTGKEQLMAALVPHLQSGVAAELLFTEDCLPGGETGTDTLRGGVFRTFPPEHGTDGFFAVGIERIPGR
jgi:16S rRNA (cytosine967-C5)-methyltransferase